MTDHDREQLGWSANIRDLELFKESVIEKWGQLEPYVQQELERAIREFLDKDDYADIEPLVNRIATATGRSGSQHKEKIARTRSSSDDRETVWISVHAPLRAELAEYAAENNMPKWQVLTAVLREYNEGGRAARIDRRLTPDLVDELEAAIPTDTSQSQSLGAVERKEMKIAGELKDNFSAQELAEVIDDITSGTQHNHSRYGPRVIDRKGVRRWPYKNKPDMFLQPELWKTKLWTKIVEHLGGSTTEAPPPFSRTDLIDAISETPIEHSELSDEELNEINNALLDRLNFEWDEEAQVFKPSSELPASSPSAAKPGW